eukprot:1879062-Prymnesium_polylepis.1
MGPNGASFIDADMFQCPGQCMSALTTMGPYGTGYCIGMCVCPEYVAAGCYTTSLVKMTMAKYNLIFPEPCGASQCCCGPQCLVRVRARPAVLGGGVSVSRAAPLRSRPSLRALY